MKYVDIRDLPPCSYSPECLRLIDDLDVPMVARPPARLCHIDELYDRRRLRQLRSHIPGCPTCSALLTETRRIRTQQRLMLNHFLLANEAHVPSTTGAIFAAIQREAGACQEMDASLQVASLSPKVSQSCPTIAPSPQVSASRSFASGSTGRQSRGEALVWRHRRLFRNFLTLATVAAVILAAVGLLNRFTSHSSVNSTPEVNNYGWDSMVIGLGLLTSMTVYNFNAANGHMTTLFASTQDAAEINLDEISEDGQSLLYDVTSPDQQRMYETFSSASVSGEFYNLSASQAGDVIWMDSKYVLVQNLLGAVLELDTQTGLVQHSWSVKTGKLAFYHQPFLYFTSAEQSGPDALYRVDLTQASTTSQQVAKSGPDTRFWLSPDGATIFYADKGSFGQEGIYAVNSDGTHLRMLLPGSGIPIGYADDNALIIMQQVGPRVEVIRLGATPEQQEQVVFSDAAPDATSFCSPSGVMLIVELCAQNIALEPYGHGLLLHAYYADGSHSLVYDNLVKGTSQKILNLAAGIDVQLPGWSKISTKGTASIGASALCA